LKLGEPIVNAPFKVLIATNGIPPVNGLAAIAAAFALPILETVDETDCVAVLTTSAIAKAFATLFNLPPPTDKIVCRLL
jgi:hypothetical protein